MAPPLLLFKNVTVMRGDCVALRDLSLEVAAGEHVCILGPNGSGKSTLIKTITRECYLLAPSGNQAENGCSISILGRERWNIFELRSLLGIAHLAERPVAQMSSGEAKRTLIARALVHDPKTLLFDEPSNALDIGAQLQLRETLRELAQSGIGILLVTHHVSEIIPEIERVVLLREGRILADGPKAAILTEDKLSELFQAKVRLSQHDGYFHLY